MVGRIRPIGIGPIGVGPIGPLPPGDELGVTSTTVLNLPLDCVLAKRIRMKSLWTEWERVPGSSGQKIIGMASGVGSLSDAKPSFSVKTNSRGY